MKSHMFLIVGVSALVLSGCSSADEKPRRGKYKAEVQLTALEMPGLTPQLKQQAQTQMQEMFARQVGTEQCIGATKKDEWKNISNDISKGMGGSCKTIRDASTDSTVDLEVQCSGPQTGEMTAVVKGAAQSDSFDMSINMDMKGMAGGGQGKVGMKITAKRTGDC